jgi:hypothetical protein
MLKRNHFLVLFLLGITFFSHAQIGINIMDPDSSALLHLESTKKGFLAPRMNTAQRDSIIGPADGLLIYNSADSAYQFFNGECWLYTFQQDCDECFFDLEFTQSLAIIDHISTDSIGIDIIIDQFGTSIEEVGLFVMSNLPDGVDISIYPPVVFGSDTAHITIEASIFSTPGVYGIGVQGVCGSSSQFAIFQLEIEPCIEVNITSDVTHYDLAAINGLPGPGDTICVVVRVFPGADVLSTDPALPTFTTGNLDPASHVGILNDGTFIAQGGDGGTGGSLTNFGSPGGDGGDAIHLTSRTTFDNQGIIFAGGGGGGSVGLGVSIPIIGNLAIGAGGGGGAANGLGGTVTISIPYWVDGQNASGGTSGTAGDGGTLNTPFSFGLFGADVSLTPNVVGGNGGDYGVDGGTGNLSVTISVSVPIFGTIFNQSLPDPPLSVFPAGGLGGMAVKRNGNILDGLFDGTYQTFDIKGNIGP